MSTQDNNGSTSGIIVPPNSFGFWGDSGSEEGVVGTSGEAIGVSGTSKGLFGVQGVCENGAGIGVNGQGSNIGVRGVSGAPGTPTQSGPGIGVQGDGSSIGVQGYSTGASGTGVSGFSNTGTGVSGQSGSNTQGSTGAAGVFGSSPFMNSNGVIGEANNGAAAYGVWGISTSGFAGYFSGNVRVTNILFKGGGGFRIDHPLDPENKYLSHSFVESPDMLNVYNGNVTTDANGDATVTLPDYFEALNQDFCYQLTVIGQFAQAIVAGEISNNQFTIKTDKPNIKVSWQVTGVRKDPFAEMHRLLTEEDKRANERGMYLHPEAYGKLETQSIEHALGKALKGL